MAHDDRYRLQCHPRFASDVTPRYTRRLSTSSRGHRHHSAGHRDGFFLPPRVPYSASSSRQPSRDTRTPRGRPYDRGRYDDLKTAQENIDLQTTILSRFDLIFIVRDERLYERDMQIAEHVLGIHAGGGDDLSLVKGEASYVSDSRFPACVTWSYATLG